MDRRKKLLIVSGDTALLEWFGEFFRRYAELEGQVLPGADDLSHPIAGFKPDVLLLDISPSGCIDTKAFETARAADPYLPVLAMAGRGAKDRVAALRLGAYGVIEKPVESAEEVYYMVMNAVEDYAERRQSAAAAAEMEARRDADRLNLLELELVKGLQHMIGETEEPASVFKHSFSLLKNYLSFEAFAALVPTKGEPEIYVYPNVALSEEVGGTITGTLIKRMAKLADENRKVRVVPPGKAAGAPAPEDLKSVIVPLATSARTCGYAGIYRGTPFGYEEESVFKRFCAHMATALEKISLFEEIKSLSVCDGLTGLLNHLSIVSKLEQEVQRSERYGSSLSVIVFDIDNFKEINDSFGHLAGDDVLVEVARLMRKGVRGIDSVGRYGGEEFLVVLPETEGRAAAAIADRVRQRLSEEPFTYGGKTIRASVSGGVAAYREGADAGRLIAIADEQLYRAKSQGKNMVCYED